MGSYNVGCVAQFECIRVANIAARMHNEESHLLEHEKYTNTKASKLARKYNSSKTFC